MKLVDGVYHGDSLLGFIRNPQGILKERFNMPLLEELVCFFNTFGENGLFNGDPETVSIAKRFAEKHSLSYFGELLERYEERDIVKDQKDLRTLVFAAAQFHSSSTVNEINSEQDTNFFKKINGILLKDYDLTTAVFLAWMDNKPLEYNEQLIDLILNNQEHIKSIFDLSLVIDLLNLVGADDAIEKVRELVPAYFTCLAQPNIDVGIDADSLYPLTHLYTVLNEPTAKKLGDSTFHRIVKSLHYLGVKEIDRDVVDILLEHTGFNEKEIYFLNWYAAHNFNMKKNRITNPGYERLATGFAKDYLAQAEPLSESMKTQLRDILPEYKQFYQCVSKNHNIYHEIFRGIRFLNKDTFNFFCNVLCPRYYDLEFRKTAHGYIAENRELFEVLSDEYKANLVREILSDKASGLEEYQIVMPLVYEYEVGIIYCSTIFKGMVEYGYLDLHDYHKLSKDNLLYYLNVYLKNNKSDIDRIGYYVKLIEAMGLYHLTDAMVEMIIEQLVKYGQKYSGSHYNKKEYQVIKGFHEVEFSQEDKRILASYLQYLEEIFFFYLPEEYVDFVLTALESEVYLEVLGITEEDRKLIKRNLINLSVLDDSTRETIRLSLMTNEEIEREKREKEEADRLADIAKQLERTINVKDFHDLSYISDKYYENDEIRQVIIDRFYYLLVNRVEIVSSGQAKSHSMDLSYCIKTIKKLIPYKVLSDQEIGRIVREFVNQD